MNINQKIFREYDIRGIVDQDLTPKSSKRLARAMGSIFSGRGKKGVALGRDCRLSSPDFRRGAMTEGLLGFGMRGR